MSDKPKTRRALFLLSWWLLMLGGGAATAQDQTIKRTVTEKPLGQVDLSKYDDKKPTFWVSPDGRHAAWLTEKGIVIDGKANEYKYGVKEKSFTFSPDGQHTAYVVLIEKKGETLVLDGVEAQTGYNTISRTAVFSPDSKHIAFFARKYIDSDTRDVLVIDGQMGKPEEDFAWEMAFTPDSKRLIFGVERPKGQMVMREQTLDGSQPPLDRPHGPATLIDNFFFGPRGQVGYIGKAAEKQFLIVYDGKEEANRFESIKIRNVVVSDDGKHVAYVAEPESFADVAVIKGQPRKVYKAFDGDIIAGSLGLSPDGSRWGYSVKKSGRAYVVLDGKDGKAYANVGGLVFSPDSKRVAYQAANGGKLLMVVDGQESPGYDKLGMPQFSPDSKSVAYWAGASGKQFLVVNGQKQKTYDSVGTPVFSSDGKRLAYLAQAGKTWLLVDGGKEGRAYDDIDGTLVFSGDGKRLATVFGKGEQQLIVVDGSEGSPYDTIVTFGGGTLHFDSADQLHYLATKGDRLFLVEETLQ